MKGLSDEFVSLVVTSPPYWGLRDYGVEGQIGLEPDFREYVGKLVAVFHELRRVLRRDGSFYLNLGDTYSASGGAGGQYRKWHSKNRLDGFKKSHGHRDRVIPSKCLLGIPWRVALALIDDGWILRNDIVWFKPNAMPSSVKDRLSNTWEHLFHFVRSRKYYYDLDAIRIPHKAVSLERAERFVRNKECFDPRRHKSDPRGGHQNPFRVLENVAKRGLNPKGRNPGDVLNVDGVTFTRRVGRITEHEVEKAKAQPSLRIKRWIYRANPKGKNPGDVVGFWSKYRDEEFGQKPNLFVRKGHSGYYDREGNLLINPLGKNPGDVLRTGDFWEIATKSFKGAHFAVYPEELCVRPILSSSPLGGLVFDPFIGSGTTAVVAKRFGRRFLGCDINPEYVRMAEERISKVEVIT